jgi:hypothetical protein
MISKDKKTFVQWYYNDTEYHQGKNQIIDPALMSDKWARELCFLQRMADHRPDLVPEIKDIDLINKKISLKIDGVDFWQRSLDRNCSFDEVLPDWQEQMLDILQAHRDLGFYKYSLHPSSYFIVDGQLKSINYFFCHTANEVQVPLSHFRSHISADRQAKLEGYFTAHNLSWDSKLPYDVLQQMTFESFRSNYPNDFIDRAKAIYVS